MYRDLNPVSTNNKYVCVTTTPSMLVHRNQTAPYTRKEKRSEGVINTGVIKAVGKR